MISKWRWLLRQFTHQLWVRASLFALVAVATALAGVAAESFVPENVPELVGSRAVGTVLNVLASSMLAATTFSLGVMVQANSAATTNVTPRAARLLMQDSTSQTVLSTFIGSFLFSLVGIVTLTIEGYGERGRLVLFVVTIGVIAAIVVALLRWIDHLSRFGQVGEITGRVERAALKAIETRAATPNLGGRPLDAAVLETVDRDCNLPAQNTGYVQHIDVAAINRWAEDAGATVDLLVLPGSFVRKGEPVAVLRPGSDDAGEATERIADGITIGDERTFEQDPRFGLTVLSEIASRALSPGINDSGTAIDVIGRAVRVLSSWAGADRGRVEVTCPRVGVLALDDNDLLDDAFMMMGRDGAGHVEVQLRLQNALAQLSGLGSPGFRAAVRRQSATILSRSDAALTEDWERDRVRAVALAGR